MTQYKYKVLQRKKELEQEGLDKEWSFMEAKFDKGKLVSITTGFKSGKRITEYKDKRRKNKIEYT
jgi:major membrane immunogen (membrane-anchored lipoprotein)|tara:strand:- start:252 stop:446 length:195 start_codon:yes stop_codon:yes gene_type:complete